MKRSRHGFTLVELLVVITIIGMLVGLLLPAVNAARESARRSTCTNNLKQLGTAIKSHDQLLGYFPSAGWGSAWVGLPDCKTGQAQPGGWIYQILPYMDNTALHDLGLGSATATTSTSVSAADSAERIGKFLQPLYCPTRRQAAVYPALQGNSASGANPSSPIDTTGPVAATGRSDYAISGGSAYILNNVNVTTIAGPTSLTATFTWPNLTNFNGIATIHSKITDAMCHDSKDTTYLVGEKYMPPEDYVTGVDVIGTYSGDLFSAFSGDQMSLVRWGSYNPSNPALSLLPTQDRVQSNNPPANPSLIFASAHGAGWNVVFLEGNARLVGWSLDPAIHQAMATRSGHEVVDESLIP
jgi:prepilin-type N-terminal cleavage/methylation domain-containing protein